MAAPESGDPRINDRIRAREVRLVDPDGAQLGIKTLPEALSIARELDLDLVEVAPLADPPVCRILDYGKWKYEAAQREKESRRKATHAAIKEMKYRPKIGGGDFDTKTRKVGEFIDQGHKVKITIMFRGREVAHPELGKRILDRIAEQLTAAKVEAAPKLDGRNMIMVLAPDRRARQASQAKSDHDEGTPAATTTAAGNGLTESQPQSGPTPTRQTPAGQPPTRPTPTGQTPTGQTPTGQTPTGQTPAGQMPSAPAQPVPPPVQTQPAQTQPAQTPPAQTQPAQVPPGQTQ